MKITTWRLLSVLHILYLTDFRVNCRTQFITPKFNRDAYNLWRLGKSVNRFSVELLNQLDPSNDTSALSPFPVAYNLASFTIKARYQTFDELCYVLNIHRFSIYEVHKIFPNLCTYIQTDLSESVNKEKGDVFKMANQIYAGRKSELYPAYSSYLKNTYNMTVPSLEFSRHEEAAKEINDWVSRETDGAIQEIIDDPEMLTNDTSLLLLSASVIQTTFMAAQAEKEDGRITIKGNFYYGEDDYLMSRAVLIPLSIESMSLCIVEPKMVSDIDFVQKRITGDSLALLLKRTMRPTNVKIQLPELDIVSPTYSLKDPLGRLGLVNMFNLNRASLHDISRFQGVHVSEILHKVRLKISVKEKEQNASNSRASRQFRQNLISNNPVHFDRQTTEGIDATMPLNDAFLYFIIDHKTELVLFLGKYFPEESAGFEVSPITEADPGTTDLVPEVTTNELTQKSTLLIPITDAFTIIDEMTSTDAEESTTTTTTTTTKKPTTTTTTTTTKAPSTRTTPPLVVPTTTTVVTTLPPVVTTTTTVATTTTTVATTPPPVVTTTTTVPTTTQRPKTTFTFAPTSLSTPPVVAVEAPSTAPLPDGLVLSAKTQVTKKPIKLKDIVKQTSIRIGNSNMKQLKPAKTTLKKYHASEGIGEVHFYKL